MSYFEESDVDSGFESCTGEEAVSILLKIINERLAELDGEEEEEE